MGYLAHRLGNFVAALRARGPVAAARKAARYAWRTASLPLCSAALRGREGPAEALDLLFSTRGAALRPLQHRGELERLLEVLAERPPRTVLELGTANGGTLCAFSRVAAPDALLVSVDLPGGRFGGGYPAWKAPFYRALARGRQEVRLLRRDSHDPRTLDDVRRALGGRPVDFLLIDADHTYEGARADLVTYGALVREGGLIALHDIATPPETGCDVARLWAELRTATRRELVLHRGAGAMGIGLLERPAGPWPGGLL